MKRDDAFPSKYLRGGDFDQPQIVTIEKVRSEPMRENGKEVMKPVAYFKGVEKGLVLNITAWDSITDIVGDDDTQSWPNHRVELYSIPVEVKGEMKKGVRVRAPQDELKLQPRPEPRTRKATPVPPPKSSVADDLDDDVPFTR
jgi:hypothetical protein